MQDDAQGTRSTSIVAPIRGHRPAANPTVRLLHVFWYRARYSVRSRRWWWTTTLWVGFWVVLGWPIYDRGIGRGLIHTALGVLMVAGRAWRWGSPQNLQLVEHEYLKRKTGLYRLIRRMQRRDALTESEARAFQTEALDLISSYVRGHRADFRGTEIYVNLLVEDGDDLVVVARNHEHRKPYARYPKTDMLAWEAFTTGEVVCTSDINDERYPSHPNRRYRSILVVPIMSDDKVIGCVSIDSTRPHHFDLEYERLARCLLPYTSLLGWTITARSTNVVSEQPSVAVVRQEAS